MNKKTDTFVATRYKNGPIQVSYYSIKGRKITLTGTKVVPAKELALRRSKVR
ncbi:MAG: hypothetical protein Q7R93_01195 [bacterium]|nr:hypothetical protein [bacterium]